MDRMKLLMDKVKEMKEQRHAFETQFREGVHKDDITSALVTCDQSNQQVPVNVHSQCLLWIPLTPWLVPSAGILPSPAEEARQCDWPSQSEFVSSGKYPEGLD